MNDDEVDDDLIIKLCSDGDNVIELQPVKPSVLSGDIKMTDEIKNITPPPILDKSLKPTDDISSKQRQEVKDDDIYDVFVRPPNYECKTRVRQITIKEAW